MSTVAGPTSALSLFAARVGWLEWLAHVAEHGYDLSAALDFFAGWWMEWPTRPADTAHSVPKQCPPDMPPSAPPAGISTRQPAVHSDRSGAFSTLGQPTVHVHQRSTNRSRVCVLAAVFRFLERPPTGATIRRRKL